MPSWYRNVDAPLPNLPRRLGVLFIVELDGGVLLDRRADDGSWAFTGGAVDEGESVLEALHREVREETGLQGRATFLGVFSDPTRLIGYPAAAVVQVVDLAFVVSVEHGTEWRKSDESTELCLFTRDQLRSVDLWPIHLPVRDASLLFDGTPVIA